MNWGDWISSYILTSFSILSWRKIALYCGNWQGGQNFYQSKNIWTLQFITMFNCVHETSWTISMFFLLHSISFSIVSVLNQWRQDQVSHPSEYCSISYSVSKLLYSGRKWLMIQVTEVWKKFYWMSWIWRSFLR